MDAIRAEISAMAEEETRIRLARLAQMGSAQTTALVSSLLSGALGLLLTLAIAFLVRRATMARRREEWLQSGQVGQAVAEGRSMLVNDVPDGYLAFGSALGKDKPRHLAILPASVG